MADNSLQIEINFKKKYIVDDKKDSTFLYSWLGSLEIGFLMADWNWNGGLSVMLATTINSSRSATEPLTTRLNWE